MQMQMRAHQPLSLRVFFSPNSVAFFHFWVWMFMVNPVLIRQVSSAKYCKHNTRTSQILNTSSINACTTKQWLRLLALANASQTICIAGASFVYFVTGPPGSNGMYEDEHGERHQRSCIFHAGTKRGVMGVQCRVGMYASWVVEQNKSMDFWGLNERHFIGAEVAWNVGNIGIEVAHKHILLVNSDTPFATAPKIFSKDFRDYSPSHVSSPPGSWSALSAGNGTRKRRAGRQKQPSKRHEDK